MTTEPEAIDALLSRFRRGDPSGLVPILQAVQREAGWLAPGALARIAGHVGLAPERVRDVAVFCRAFRFQPVGRLHVQVCRGTTCHVKGAERALAALEGALGIAAGTTTPDGRFSLEAVACLGLCSRAPFALVNGRPVAPLDDAALRALLTDGA